MAHFRIAGQFGAVGVQSLSNLGPDPKYWIERAAGLLKYIADYAAANLAKLVVRHLQNVSSIQEDLAADVPRGRRRNQPADGQSGHTFAAAAFTNEANRLAGG